jgi:hypothetical protein
VTLSCERALVAVGVVNLGYVGNVFAYVVEKDRPDVLHERDVLLPLARGIKFAPSSLCGETRWRSSTDEIRLSHQGEWKGELDLEVGGARLTGEFSLAGDQSLALVHPLGEGRAAYTHKEAGLAASGSLSWGKASYPLDGGMGAVDWTRSLADRHTHWKWASLSGVTTAGRPVGLNLSAEVYDDSSGSSRENAMWIDHAVSNLGAVSFVLPNNPRREPWHLTSRDTDEVDLEFRPFGAREQRVDYGVIRSHFVQAYGTYHGKLGDHQIDGVYGLAEDHDALW